MMPVYTMKCSKCEEIFEIKQSIKDKLPRKCKCGGRLKSIICPALIVYKTGGFHCTDYGSDGGLKGDIG